MTEPKCPECERVHEVAPKSQAIGEFVEWLESQGIVLATYHEHTEGCYNDEDFLVCGYRKDQLQPDHRNIQSRLAEFFGIDLNKVEKERRALLKYLAEKHS